jgi:predicted nucleic acid-binding Zn ribbon protein
MARNTTCTTGWCSVSRPSKRGVRAPLSTMRGGKSVSAVDRAEPPFELTETGESGETVEAVGSGGASGPGEAAESREAAETAEVPEDLPATALADAQSLARSRPRARKQGRARTRDTSGRGGYSGPGPDDNDPQLVGSVLAGYVEDRGWQQPLAAARVFADWSALVGEDVAAHCRPMTLTAGELKVEAESTAWATQLRLLASTVLARLVDELGPHVVTKVHFTGPVGPSWKHGGFSIRGARGPRDTYG